MCGPKPCNSPTCTWSEAYRKECEARYLLRLPLLIRLEALAEKPRAARLDALKAEMQRQHEANR